ncbi:unnamed protein product [Closterium sp. NIES-53]
MSKVLIAEGLGYKLLSISQLMAKGIHLEADSTTHEFKLYNGKGGLYIGKAVLKNNVSVLDFVPDLGTADSDGIVTFTSWTHPPDLDPDFSPEGFWYLHTIPEAERTRALATIQHSAAAESTPAAAETTSAAAETTAAAVATSTPIVGPSTASAPIDDTPPTPAQQLNPTSREGMYRLTKGTDYILLIVYVDDLLYIGSTNNVITWFEKELQKDLTLTVSSTVTQYLGLNIQEEEDAIYLNAAKYADTIAKRFALTPTTISTPYRYTPGNNKEGSAPLKPAGIRDYQRKLGCLLFAAVTCRPDLSYSASQLATYLKKPEAEHMAELDQALHYLVSTSTVSLNYHKNGTTTPKLIGYVDADHADDSDNRRSRTGYIYRFEPIGPISWQSSKQDLITLSSAEAEYIALYSATKEGLYLRELLEEAKLAQLPSFSLFCDNQSVIRIANKNGYANRTKHIALRYFFVKDEIEKARFELSFCPTSEMAAWTSDTSPHWDAQSAHTGIRTRDLRSDNILNAAAAKDLPPHRSHDGERRLIARWTNPLPVRTTTWSSELLTVSPSTFQFPPFPVRIKKGPTHLAHRKKCLAVSIARLQKWSHEVKGKSLGHLTPEVKKKFGELNLVPAVIFVGCTSEIQPLDVAVNRSFKAAVRQLYQEWFEREGVDTLTKKGERCSSSWISAVWKSVPKELIQRAFLTCGISNALDGSQDKLCLQHRRDELEGEEVDMDDEIAAHSFFCNNVEEPESDSEADPDDPTAADD